VRDAWLKATREAAMATFAKSWRRVLINAQIAEGYALTLRTTDT